MLKLFNSLTRKTEEFKPITDKSVGLYTCGPTVYNYAHIGNLRTYLFEDFLRRTLVYNDYEVKHVMNITDVGHLSGDQDFGEDKMEKEGGSANEILSLAKKYTDAFLIDLQTLNILKADVLAPATDHVSDQIELINKLFEKGFAYETELAIYFDVAKFKNYGVLTGQKMEEKKVGARSDVVLDNNKKHPADFALWFKLAGKYKNHILRWESPWGQGFPGWHIECSAMARKYLGQPFDIHTGGIDHLFPHHTNEIAQSEAAFDQPLANFWLHGEHLLIQSGRMGKSEGNILTLQSIVDKGFNPLAYRYLVLTSHYRSKLNFTDESLTGAQNALNNLYQEISTYDSPAKILPQYQKQFDNAINNDLETPQALAVVWDMIKSEAQTADKLATLIKFDEVLGLKIKEVWTAAKVIPETVRKLIDERQLAKKEKDFTRSDELRRTIESNGYIVEDTIDGFKVKKKF
ncbi:MAG: cysteine--tRNA ligase [Candidatus Doudnabacteria bacterium]|nr:cysteine--tRNA ligase [Candidatus Doudnabacteria bacterium]